MSLKKLWIALGVLVLLTPLGLIARGNAWGEWEPEEFKNLVGYVPEKMAESSGLFGAPFSAYAVPGLKGTFFSSSLGYIFSAVLGVGIIVVIVYGLGKIFLEDKEEKENGSP